MHYHEHLGKQAVSFLRNLMKQYSNDKFEEQFFEMLKSYPSLNGLLLSDMKEEHMNEEKQIEKDYELFAKEVIGIITSFSTSDYEKIKSIIDKVDEHYDVKRDYESCIGMFS